VPASQFSRVLAARRHAEMYNRHCLVRVGVSVGSHGGRMSTTHSFHELKEKNVHELREIAKGIQHEAVQGYTQLNKDHLLAAIAKALNLPTHEHHAVGEFDKLGTKARMRSLRKQRDEALEGGDKTTIHEIRRQLHKLNHQVRSHTVDE
jgi:hypothetical protein